MVDLSTARRLNQPAQAKPDVWIQQGSLLWSGLHYNGPRDSEVRVKRLWKETWGVRWFGLRKIPLIWFVRPDVLRMDMHAVRIRIRLRRRTKNHLGSMYFGVLAVGADLAGGLAAMNEIGKSGKPIALIFKDMKADFLKRADGDTEFHCEDGPQVRELVQRAVESGERVEMPVRITATVPENFGDEPVARFQLTLSLKLKV